MPARPVGEKLAVVVLIDQDMNNVTRNTATTQTTRAVQPIHAGQPRNVAAMAYAATGISQNEFKIRLSRKQTKKPPSEPDLFMVGLLSRLVGSKDTMPS